LGKSPNKSQVQSLGNLSKGRSKNKLLFAVLNKFVTYCFVNTLIYDKAKRIYVAAAKGLGERARAL
jgi:hypothetical protein